MKIATFNINNVNRRLPDLLNWLKAAKPDVVCLQELKCEQGVRRSGKGNARGWVARKARVAKRGERGNRLTWR